MFMRLANRKIVMTTASDGNEQTRVLISLAEMTMSTSANARIRKMIAFWFGNDKNAKQ